MKHLKHTKKFIYLLAALILSILLSACGGGSEGEDIQISNIIIYVPDGYKSPLIDQTFQLTATAIYDDLINSEEITSKVKWRSSNSEVATVSKTGEITTLLDGIVTITASYADITSEEKIDVRLPPSIESVTIVERDDGYILNEESSIDLTVNSLFSDDTTNQDNSLYDWSSSDEEIATVDASGKIMGVSHGEVAIKATLKTNPEVNAEINAIVNAQVVGISAVDETIYLKLGDTSTKLTIHEELSDGTLNPIPTRINWTYDPSDKDIVRIKTTGEIEPRNLGLVNAIAKYGRTNQDDLTLSRQIVVESPIELFVLKDTDGIIKLAWNPKHNASSYTLFWNSGEENEVIEIDDPNTFEFTHNNIDTGKLYTYQLAFTRNGELSERSEELKVWPHVGKWQFRDVNESRILAAGASYQEKMYLFGGELTRLIDPDAPIKGFKQVLTNEVWEYNITKNTWTRADSLQTPLRNATACSDNESIYVIGGEDETGSVVDTIHLFNATQSKWNHNFITLPTPLSKVSCSIINKMIYITGGFDGTDAVDTTYRYDITNETWNTEPLPTLNTARYNHASTILDGKIYVAGGNTLTDIATRQVEVLDSAAETLSWTSLSNMDLTRSSFALHTWNGLLHAIGGTDINSNIINDVESYNPIDDSWQSTSIMPFPNTAFNSTLYNKGVYIFGGTKNSSESTHEYSDYMKYTINDGNWFHGTNPDAARAEFSAVTLADKLYLLGGTNFSGPSADIRSYDTKNNSWEKLNSLAVPRQRASSVAYNAESASIIYTIGGISDGVHLTSIESYNTKSNTSTLLPNSMGIGRTYAAVAMLGKNIYVFGGDSSESSETFEVFDTTRGSWSIPRNLPQNRKRSHATAVALNNKIYLIGGKIGEHNDKKASDTIEIYTPATDSWDEAPGSNLEVARFSLGSAVLNGKIYVFGGKDISNRPTNFVESLTPFTRNPNDKPLWNREDSLPLDSSIVLGGNVENKIYLLSEEGDKSSQLFNNIFVLE